MTNPVRKTIRVSLETSLLELTNEHTDRTKETLSEFINKLLKEYFK